MTLRHRSIFAAGRCVNECTPRIGGRTGAFRHKGCVTRSIFAAPRCVFEDTPRHDPAPFLQRPDALTSTPRDLGAGRRRRSQRDVLPAPFLHRGDPFLQQADAREGGGRGGRRVVPGEPRQGIAAGQQGNRNTAARRRPGVKPADDPWPDASLRRLICREPQRPPAVAAYQTASHLPTS